MTAVVNTLRLAAVATLIGFVLGSLFETSIHQTLAIGYGDPLILFRKPISAVILAVTALVILWPLVRRILRIPPAEKALDG